MLPREHIFPGATLHFIRRCSLHLAVRMRSYEQNFSLNFSLVICGTKKILKIFFETDQNFPKK